jgi:iron complex transport system substrate-binding protein
MKKYHFLTHVTVAMLLSTLTASAAPFTCKDKMGRTVTVQTPVKRAVLFETYELLPATGAWNQVVGISRYGRTNDLLLAIRPEISRLPDIGSARDANAEVLLKLNPDVVLTYTINPQMVRFLEQKGLTVIAVYPESIPELYEVMRLQGKLFGKEKKVETTIVKMATMFNLIRTRVAKIPANARKKGLYLSGKQTNVTGRIGVNNDLFTLIGLENVAKEVNEHYREIPLEKIILWNPEVIFIWGNAGYSAADLIKTPQWRHIRAIKQRTVYKAPAWGTWSPRLAPIALWMAASAYPEQFKDIDITKAIDRFYRDVYGIPYAKAAQIE